MDLGRSYLKTHWTCPHTGITDKTSTHTNPISLWPRIPSFHYAFHLITAAHKARCLVRSKYVVHTREEIPRLLAVTSLRYCLTLWRYQCICKWLRLTSAPPNHLQIQVTFFRETQPGDQQTYKIWRDCTMDQYSLLSSKAAGLLVKVMQFLEDDGAIYFSRRQAIL